MKHHPNLYEIAAQSQHIEKSEASLELINDKAFWNQFLSALEGSDMIPAL